MLVLRLAKNRRYATRSTVLCAQCTPAERHSRLGGKAQVDETVNQLAHGTARIDLDGANVRKLLAEKK